MPRLYHPVDMRGSPCGSIFQYQLQLGNLCYR